MQAFGGFQRLGGLLVVAIALGTTSCRYIIGTEEYDLVASKNINIVYQKLNTSDVSQFLVPGNPGVFSAFIHSRPGSGTGKIRLNVSGRVFGGTHYFDKLRIDCDTARLKHQGITYMQDPDPSYSKDAVQPVKCRAGQIVDAFQTAVPHTYPGSASIEFTVPVPLKGPVFITLPHVNQAKAADGVAGPVTVEYRIGHFLGSGGMH